MVRSKIFTLPKGNQSGCWDHQIHGKVTHDLMLKKERESDDMKIGMEVKVYVPRLESAARTLVLLFQFAAAVAVLSLRR